MKIKAVKTDTILEGSMTALEIEGKQIVVCRTQGKVYAFERACGHHDAGMETGTIDGVIVTCPKHYVQFDVTTGEALNMPIPKNMGFGPDDMPLKQPWFRRPEPIRDLKVYPASVSGEWIEVEIS